MNLTPGSATYDSRSLSVEAAQYDAEAIDAEAEVRQLEARMLAMRAKAEKARLQQQQTETAREDAFQKEREERQSAVRESITDHHLEGIRKAINHDQHLINDLKKVAADNIDIGSNATAFVSAMVLRELVGCDDSFLTETARKVLVNPDPVDATAQSGLQQSQDCGPLPRHMISPKLAPKLPTPTTSPSRLSRSFHAPLPLPRSSLYERDKLPGLGNEDSEVTGSLIDQDNHDFDAREPGLVVVETNLTTGEDDYEIQVSNEERKAPREIIDPDEENDAASSWTNDESNRAEQSLDTTSGIEYSTEQDEVIAANAHSAILKQEPPVSIYELASLAKHKRQSTGTINSYEIDSVSASSASFHRPSSTTHEGESTFDDPRTTQPSTPIPQKSLVGLDAQVKASPASKITSGKRKRQESETASVGRSGEITTTPASKKGKTKPKDDNTVPKRVADFIKLVKAMESESQPEAVLCSICGELPRAPRLSNCLHMYCEMCWKSTAEKSGKTKGMEQPCMQKGCPGVLGRAVNVPAHLKIANMRSEMWTGQKTKRGIAPVEDQHEDMDVNKEDSMHVE